MKTGLSLILPAFISFSLSAQQTITMRGLWAKPEVQVIFGDYRIFFTIKDINKAMELLPVSEQTVFGLTSGLDTSRTYIIELLRSDMEYRNNLQPLIQRGVGTCLLMGGRAAIVKKNGRKVHTIQANTGPPRDVDGSSMMPVDFYDSRTGNIIFSGWMDMALYKKDIGFD